jgi:hypothetical protein
LGIVFSCRVIQFKGEGSPDNKGANEGSTILTQGIEIDAHAVGFIQGAAPAVLQSNLVSAG